METLQNLKSLYSKANELVCEMRYQSIQALIGLLNNAEDRTIDLTEIEDKILISKITTPPAINIANYVCIENGDVMVGTEIELIDAYDCEPFDLATIAIYLLEQKK